MAHIVFLCDEYPPKGYGGIGVFTKATATALAKDGFEVTVIGLGRQNKSRVDEGVTVMEYAGNYSPIISNFINRLKLRKILSNLMVKKPFQILEAPDWNGLLYLSHKFTGHKEVKKVVRLHGSMTYLSNELEQKTNPLLKHFESKTLNAANYIVGVSEYIYNSTVKLLPLTKKTPHSIIYNGVDVTRFKPASKESAATPLKVLFIGRLSRLKGIHELVNAWNIVNQELPDAELILVGKDTTYDKDSSLKWSQVIKKTLTTEAYAKVNYIESLPHSDLPALIKEADVCVYPSKIEAMGLVVVEAMAMGKAVIHSNTGPGPELIDEGINGRLINPNNINQLADVLIHLLKHEQERVTLGLNARKKVETLFSAAMATEKNIELYSRLIHDVRKKDK